MKGIAVRALGALGFLVIIPLIPIFLFAYKFIEGPVLLMRWIITGK